MPKSLIFFFILGLLVVFLLIIILGDIGYVASFRFYKRERNFRVEKSYCYSPQARELWLQNPDKRNIRECVIDQVKDDNGPGKFKSLKSKKLKSFSETMRLNFEKCLTSLAEGQNHGWLLDVGHFDTGRSRMPNRNPNHIPNYIQNPIPNVSIESIDSISEYQPRLNANNQARVYRNRKPTLDFGESDWIELSSK